MTEIIKTNILNMVNKSTFSFDKRKVLNLIEEYSKFRNKSQLKELTRVVVDSLKDGNIRVFEGAPGTGKSKVIHVYALLGLMEGKNKSLS